MAAKPERDGRIAGKAGVGIQNLVSRINQHHHRHEKRDLAPWRDDNLSWRNLQIAGLAEIVCDGCAQSRYAGDRSIAVLAFIQSPFEGLVHGRSRMKIRLTKF